MLAQKKLLVKEVHAQRRDLQHKKRDADLYKHAVIGVEKEIERIRQEQIVATGRDGEIERAIQKVGVQCGAEEGGIERDRKFSDSNF